VKTTKLIATFVAIVLCVSSCTTAPIQKPISFRYPDHLDASVLDRLVRFTLNQREGWTHLDTRRNVTTARFRQRQHSLKVKISHDDRNMTVSLLSSVYLKQSPRRIHKNANQWVKDLALQLKRNIGDAEYRRKTASKPDQTFTFSIETIPTSAVIYVNDDGVQRRLGRTPLSLDVKLSGSYLKWTPQHSNNSRTGRLLSSDYVIHEQRAPAVSVRAPDTPEAAPVLDFNFMVIADGYETQVIDRAVTFLKPCNASTVRSCIPEDSEIVVGLTTPSRPEHSAHVTIDSIPSGARIYAMGDQGYLGGELGSTPTEIEVGFAYRRSATTGEIIPSELLIWHSEGARGFVTKSEDGTDSAFLNFSLFKDGFAQQDVRRWTFLNPDTEADADVTKRVTIPLKTFEQARHEKLVRIDEARVQLLAAIKKTEHDLRRSEISNEKELMKMQGVLSSNLARLETLSRRVTSTPSGTTTVRHDPHYEREWQDGMAALGAVMRPYSKQSDRKTEESIQALQGLGVLMDLLD
jgi:hypothetical protein